MNATLQRITIQTLAQCALMAKRNNHHDLFKRCKLAISDVGTDGECEYAATLLAYLEKDQVVSPGVFMK